jgi:nicotinate-nucleotide pyrophosphorylase (carboxylating)
LIKDNHIATTHNFINIIKKAIKNKKGKKITVEIDNLNQLKKVIGLKFDRILFDNMSAKNLRKAVKMSKRYYETEASGGITLKNIKKISSTGVHRISIGQITHSAPTVDCKLDFIS